jgi:CheY-like chemotaxis protein
MKKKLNCILIIDDDEPTNFISRMLIEEAGCTEHIEVAQSGRAALNYLLNNEDSEFSNKNFPRPDLIFLDINMPAMNGWEFLHKYNELKNGNKSEIITIILTTSLNPDDRLKADEMNEVSDFESKPLTSEKLNRILKKYFGSYF